jgi:esterase
MPPVALHALRYGTEGAPAILILHGLLGSIRNWTTIAGQLGACYDVHCLDLRNHGASPHADSMRWDDLASDIAAYANRQGLHEFAIIGHSLGGKVAMRFAVDHPTRVKALVVVDIVQRTYPPFHAKAFNAMQQLDLTALNQRQDADRLLQVDLPDWAFRQFILTNLVRDSASRQFYWRVNLDCLMASLSDMAAPSIAANATYSGPTLLIAGGLSDFVHDGDASIMRQHFPLIDIQWMPKVGHNVQVEDRAGFLVLVEPFLARACHAPIPVCSVSNPKR